MTEGATLAPRRQGWPRALAALAAFLLLPALPPLSVILPVRETYVLLLTALAALALVGWWAGGRIWFALVWGVGAAWVLGPIHAPVAGLPGWLVAVNGAPVGAYGALVRGWAVLLTAAIGFMSLIDPRRFFFPRALSATGLALAAALAVAALGRQEPEQAARVVARQYSARTEAYVALERKHNAALPRDTDDARELADALRRWNEQNAETLRLLARVMPRLLPATLALESLIALALAWSLYHRLNRTRVGPPLARLRDFRFSDELVWGVIVGLVLALVPTLKPLRGAGYNLLAFFGALYALRGLGVLSWFFSPGRAAAAVLILLGSVFLPVSLPLALGLGLGDTWLDLRSRARPTT
jgi:Predicted membrane protein (DUF2232)